MKNADRPASNSAQKTTDSTTQASCSRRGFLKTAAAVGAAAPYIWTSSYASAEDLSSKPTIAAIGVGGSRGRFCQGRAIAHAAARFGRMIAVCDVDDLHNQEFNAGFGGKLSTYQDYRKLFEKEQPDIVTIGTPDHWHVPIAIHAMEHGADVYCEKPLTLTIAEGEVIKKAVERTGRVFQVGSMQRSWDLFMYAVAIVQSGRLGKKVTAHCGIDGAPVGGPFETTSVPKGLDWDLWLGPAPKKGYCDERRKFFRWYLEYSGGKMTDWGAHHVDIAQWALGLDHTPIQHVSGTGQLTPIVPDSFDWNRFLDGQIDLPNGYNSATEFHINLEYSGGSLITVHNRYESGATKFGNGILFEGEKGRIFVNRSKLQGSAVKDIFGDNMEKRKNSDGRIVNNRRECIENMDDATRKEFDEMFKKLNKGKPVTSHMDNFYKCVADRSEPMSDVASHVNAMNSLHMCNITLMLGRELEWDGATGQFVGDDQANALMDRKRRAGFELEA